jgi:hypothetical protein
MQLIDTPTPTISLPALYHIGTLDASQRGLRSENHAGHLLAASVCPAAWQRIAKLGGNPLHHLSRPDGLVLLDVLAAEKDPGLNLEIAAWAVDNGYAEHRTLWQAWSYDVEADDDATAWRFTLHETQAKAANEIEDEEAEGPNGPPVEPLFILAGTPKLEAHVGVHNLGRRDAFEYAALVWAEATQPDLDGAYWTETYDPHSLSAPRGGIFPSKLPELSIRDVDWKQAPVGDELIRRCEADCGSDRSSGSRSNALSL